MEAAAEGSEDKKKKKKMVRMPTPEALISHYENQEGMSTRDASLKVIQDLQEALLRSVAANRNRKSAADTKKLDAINSRLFHLEMKLDSKPSYPQAVAVGVVSSGIWTAAVQLWNLVRKTES